MTTQTIEWEEEASRLYDQFDPDAARPVHGLLPRRLRRALIEERARDRGMSTVDGAMMNELLELQARWGWQGVVLFRMSDHRGKVRQVSSVGLNDRKSGLSPLSTMPNAV